MPKINGIQFIQKIRSINKDIPILILSAYENKEILYSTINQNIQGYLLKPLNFKLLTQHILKIKKKYDEEYLLKQYQEITDNSSIILKTDATGTINYVNDTFCQFFNYSPKSILGQSYNIIVAKNQPSQGFKSILSKLQKPKSIWKGLLLQQDRKGKHYYLRTTIKPIFNEYEELVEFISLSVPLSKEEIDNKNSNDFFKPLDNIFENLRNSFSKFLLMERDTVLLEEKPEISQKLKVSTMLKEAIKSKNIVSYFQPIINNHTKKVEKYESLVRLIDKEKNILTPYHFLETAKESELYDEITKIVINNSFRVLNETNIYISINLSARDIERKATREYFIQLLQKNSKQTHRIVVELLEDERIHDVQKIKTFIETINTFGVKIAIDDFGTGFSNFTRVLYYKPDYIKIDGSLIRDIENNDLAKSMVESIVIFAQKANIKTIAEFVENENIFNIICDLGVDYSQGYYFGEAKKL